MPFPAASIKNLIRGVLPSHPYSYLGRLLTPFLGRSYKASIEAELLAHRGRQGFLAKVVRAEILRRYYRGDDATIRQTNRKVFWGSDAGKKWHELKLSTFDASPNNDDFLRYKLPLVSQIQQLVTTSRQFRTICEIGTGHGLFLEYLRDHLEHVDRFIGVDLNEEQIADNRLRVAADGIEFVCKEITDYVREDSDDGIVFVACGTFQYFTQAELIEFLGLLRERLGMAAVAFSETVNIDLAAQQDSVPRGYLAFSHNYPFLLKQCDYIEFDRLIMRLDESQSEYQSVVMTATSHHVRAP